MIFRLLFHNAYRDGGLKWSLWTRCSGMAAEARPSRPANLTKAFATPMAFTASLPISNPPLPPHREGHQTPRSYPSRHCYRHCCRFVMPKPLRTGESRYFRATVRVGRLCLRKKSSTLRSATPKQVYQKQRMLTRKVAASRSVPDGNPDDHAANARATRLSTPD
jgi:hypothetical protein